MYKRRFVFVTDFHLQGECLPTSWIFYSRLVIQANINSLFRVDSKYQGPYIFVLVPVCSCICFTPSHGQSFEQIPMKCGILNVIFIQKSLIVASLQIKCLPAKKYSENQTKTKNVYIFFKKLNKTLMIRNS